MSEHKYKAFICYSHKDESWARWLHRALESYNIPRKLVGRESDLGPIPNKLYPIFRDREELSSATDLTDTIKDALQESASLIVICSPSAVKSRWVNEEIKYFQSLGRGKRVYSLIVDGDPEASDPEFACFPPALLKDPSGALHEPLAADARKWADGRLLANLKLLSGLLGISLEELRQRDLKQRQRKWAFALSIILVGVVLVALTIGFRFAAEKSEKVSESRRSQATELVKHKLDELSSMYQTLDDPEDLDRLKSWDKQDLADLIVSAGKGEGALINSAMKLREQGNELTQNDKLAEALGKYLQSWALIAESYRRDRSNHDTFFELGQAEFYIGQAYVLENELDKAEEALLSYAEITRRLVQKQPERADLVVEVSYILTNLAVVQMSRGDDPDRSLRLMRSTLEYLQLALILDPSNKQYRSAKGNVLAWYADAQLSICELDSALALRQKGVALLAEEMLQEESESTTSMRRMAYALRGLANAEESLGRLDDAQNNWEKSLQQWERIPAKDSNNSYHTGFVLLNKQRIAWLMAVRGNTQEAWVVLNALADDWQDFLKDLDIANYYTSRYYTDYTEFLLFRVWVSQTMNDSDTALRLLDEALERLAESRRDSEDFEFDDANTLMLAAFWYWELQQKLPAANIQALLPNYKVGGGRVRACTGASMAARKAVMNGNMDLAQEYVDYLLEKRYQVPKFVRFCSKYELCNDDI